jgi:hypothetical protein
MLHNIMAVFKLNISDQLQWRCDSSRMEDSYEDCLSRNECHHHRCYCNRHFAPLPYPQSAHSTFACWLSIKAGLQTDVLMPACVCRCECVLRDWTFSHNSPTCPVTCPGCSRCPKPPSPKSSVASIFIPCRSGRVPIRRRHSSIRSDVVFIHKNGTLLIFYLETMS